MGGTYQYSQSMLEGLRYSQGYEVTLYADPANRDFAQFGYPVRGYAETRGRQMEYLLADGLGLRLEDPFHDEDILIAPTYSLGLLHTKKSFAYTLHDLQECHYPQNFSWAQRRWRSYIHSRLAHRATEIICESQYVKSDIVKIVGVSNEKVAVIVAPPLRQEQADFSPATVVEVQRRLNLPDCFIFYPAQFWPHKNHLRLVAAFKQVVQVKPDLKLVLTGRRNDQFGAVMKAVAHAGLEESVRHVGYVQPRDLQVIYHLASALVMPSLFESVSIPIYEAFQAGTPVIASDILSIPEQVGGAALLFDPFSISCIAKSILKIVRDPTLAESLVEKGKEKLKSMTTERYGVQLQGLLDRL